jgi:hypothetical protein
MADDADGGGLWRINTGGSISLLISSRRHSGFTIRNTAFLQSGVPFVRLTRWSILIAVLRVSHHHGYRHAKLRRNLLMRESVKAPVTNRHSAQPVRL